MLVALQLCVASGAAAPVTNTADSPGPPPPGDTYQLNVQDKLVFRIHEDPMKGPAPEEISVTPQGELNFRVTRGSDEMITINARGKTLAQVRQELKARLEADYYHTATAELKLKEQSRRAGQVLFFGAVRNNLLPLVPGEPKTIFEGVYQVGVNEFANLKKVKLSRVDPKTGKPETTIINLEAIKKGDRTQDVQLQDGDRIEIPEKSIVF